MRELPKHIASRLLDIDLAEPIDVAPRRMAAGGIVLVDDRTDDQARWSYDRFIAEMGPGPARSRSARA